MPTMTLQGDFTAGELSPSLSARVDMAKYGKGCRTLKNFLVQPHGGAVKRPGFLLLDELPGEAALIPFVFNPEQAYWLLFGEYTLRVANPQGMILGADGKPYEIASPYTLAQAKKLYHAQSGDVLFLTCRDVVPHKLKRLGHAQWEFEAMRFIAPIAPPATAPTLAFVNAARKSDGSPSAAQLVTPYTYFVTAVTEQNGESEASDGASITGPASNNWQGGDYLTVSWAAVPDAVEYRVYKAEFGGRPGYIASTGELSYHDYNARPTISDGPPKYVDPFPDNGFPGVCCFFQQRLAFASSSQRPATFWMSRSGDYGNFSTSVPLKADDAIERTFASGAVSEVCWMLPLRSLVVGTAGMEWEVRSLEGAFTAKTAEAKEQSYWGSASIRSLGIGNAILYVARSGRQVRDLRYDFGADSYGGIDRTILAAHLLVGRNITGWTYQAAPDSIVWSVRDDGVLLGMTYQAEHEVCAWHRHHTDGAFRAVCSIPDKHDDALAVVVERNGRFFFEVMAPRFEGGETAGCVYLDCAMQYRGAPVAEVAGLDHLEGREVGILADGAVQAARVVHGGKVVLDGPAEVVTVGLPYEADLETMPVEIVGPEGASVGRKKYINAVNILFQNTVTALVGTSFKRLESIAWRTTEPHGRPLAPASGTKRQPVAGMAENTVTVCIRSDAPLPMTVLAVMPELDIK